MEEHNTLMPGDIDGMSPEQIISENNRRMALRRRREEFDPIRGIGSSGRRVLTVLPQGIVPDGESESVYLPEEMLADEMWGRVADADGYRRLRSRYDFEYWAATCVRICDKETGARVNMRLNYGQRKVVSELEGQRRAGQPMRLIVLKARQWGASTLVQMYMCWIQLLHVRGRHSLTAAHMMPTAMTLQTMVGDMLAEYPEYMIEEEREEREEREEIEKIVQREAREKKEERGKKGKKQLRLRGCVSQTNTRTLSSRQCRLTLASAENGNAVRGLDISLAHLSEVAFWRNGPRHDPLALTRAVCAGISDGPMTLVVMESTANGVGNFFHNEWLRTQRGQSDKKAVFVPWYEIERYSIAEIDEMSVVAGMDDYERHLWRDLEVPLQAIAWYQRRRREYPDISAMKAEYPSDDVEAFVNTGSGVFSVDEVEALRRGCENPVLRGEVEGRAASGREALQDTHFTESERGCLEVWRMPDAKAPRDSYVVSVDVGGRTAGSDWSVIAVFDRRGERPELVAQWRGHTDHDLLAWKAASIARWAGEALLVIESNSLESRHREGQGAYILSLLREAYPNLYIRSGSDDGDSLQPGRPERLGFHVNRSTKGRIISNLIMNVREGAYTERCSGACDELLTYEQTATGAYAARRGYHDDMLMTRAIALEVMRNMDPAPASDKLEPRPEKSGAGTYD